MTTTTNHEAFQPFQVKSSLLNNTAQPGSRGGGPAGTEPPGGSDFWNFSGDADAGAVKLLAGMLCASAYALSQRYAEIAPLMILLLIACVILRLNRRERQFASVPIAVAGIRLALNVASSFVNSRFIQVTPAPLANNVKPEDFGVTWLPLFLAICLFYMPKRVSITAKIVLACSVVLLVTGLMPGEGYLYMFAMVQFMLFMAIGIGLILDFVPRAGNGAHREAVWGARS